MRAKRWVIASPDTERVRVLSRETGYTPLTAAVLSALTGADAGVTVGRGAGLSEEQFALKRDVVRRGIALNQPDPTDPVDVLGKVGGLDICAMTGAYIGAAQSHTAAIVDGFIGMVGRVRDAHSARCTRVSVRLARIG